ncbi:TM2 domain-containing protein [Flavobacterium psychrotrophum]|uniref:TM2 domain-containing protein n=1 Tax=Flavobacterium psychrotrophum TaxID=2294119 RepID=UPI000E30F1C1|nr:TM2 domain-containing protein [Flavobacterium psychrotrophum]
MDLIKGDASGITKTDLYILTHARYFQPHHLSYIREKLSALDESRWQQVYTTDLKDPGNIQLISLFAGNWGIDRFMIGDTGLGIGKLLTCGGFFIWTIVDWFSIVDATRLKNMERLQQALA